MLAACSDERLLTDDSPGATNEARNYTAPMPPGPTATPGPATTPDPNVIAPALDPNSIPPPIPGVNDQAPVTVVPTEPRSTPPVTP